MKKVKLSLIVALAILGASVTAFTEKSSNPTDGWYAQSQAGPPYSFDNPVSETDALSNCPLASSKICAVKVVNGNVSITRMSTHFYP